MLDRDVRLFANSVAKIHDPLKKAEYIIHGCIKYFPFDRASIFSYSHLVFQGKGVLQVEEEKWKTIDWIKEDVRNIPIVFQSLMSKQPIIIEEKETKQNFPLHYIEIFQLSSICLVPILYQTAVVGCVMVDKYKNGPQINTSILSNLFQYLQTTVSNDESTYCNKSLLSKRETEALQLVANGLSQKEIASLLAISDFTVRDYVSSAMRKLGANHRAEAVAIAMRKAIIQ
ncbi:DNA-binding response regulator [Bacillus sp. HMF5848]|uniref:response regulator transcription factor n=1 Tax=Bacillus sp. HMF5848 TaxID=2495421 RepID=UPI000F7A5007|nr:LuxR C-terminal-related transcriptional regulator [Bacillus sp. HMF5848]RSK27216.1 DNA-binding response regulator [Bacillus sp. HMF5848]